MDELIEARKAKEYLTQYLRLLMPQTKSKEDFMSLCLQIKDYIAERNLRLIKLERALSAIPKAILPTSLLKHIEDILAGE